MNDKGVERLLRDKFTLGGDATVAAGPVGRVAQAETDARMTAEILTWSRARGLFAGVALNGATLREDEDWNMELYGKPLKNRDIVSGSVPAPKAAAALLNELDRYSSRK
jgi:lipid-binding SYLF domain-containing protein